MRYATLPRKYDPQQKIYLKNYERAWQGKIMLAFPPLQQQN